MRSFSLLILSMSFLAFPLAASDKAEILYFAVVDRFANGDSSNDTGFIAGAKEQHGFSPENLKFYHGGDIQGLENRLPYLKDLGITGIWLSPIMENLAVNFKNGVAQSAYHGYWISRFDRIDPHFGNEDHLKSLIAAAHEMGIKIFLDIVVNHSADVIRFRECHNPDGSHQNGNFGCYYRSAAESQSSPYTPFIPEGLKDSKSPAWLNDPRFYHNQGDSVFQGESNTLGDFFGLDDLRTSDPQVRDGLIAVFKEWMRNYRFDGFRLDTVKHVDPKFWQVFTKQIKAYSQEIGLPDFFIFGEVLEGNPHKTSPFVREHGLDAALDFPLYYSLRRIITDGKPARELLDVLADDDLYNNHSQERLLSFVSNHDKGRLGHYIKSIKGISDDEALQIMQLAYSFLYFSRGIPVIYYGDEQGFVGGPDDMSREDMFPSLTPRYQQLSPIGSTLSPAHDNFDKTHPIYQSLASYGRFLQDEPGLQRALTHPIDYQGPVDTLALHKVAKDFEYLLLYNFGGDVGSISWDMEGSPFQPVFGNSDKKVSGSSIKLAPYSFAIYKRPRQIPELTLDKFRLLTPDVTGKVDGFVEIKADAEAVVGVALDSQLKFKITSPNGISTHSDRSYPYRAFLDSRSLKIGDKILVELFLSNASGERKLDQASLSVGELEGLKIYFKPDDSWSSPMLYFYNTYQSATTWPGPKMAPLGNGWYFYQLDPGTRYASIIFNDASGHETRPISSSQDVCIENDRPIAMDSCPPLAPKEKGQ